MKADSFNLDVLAKELAADEGQAWHELGDFPGYARNIWREAARLRLVEKVPGAMFEALPALHDGRDGGWQVHLP